MSILISTRDEQEERVLMAFLDSKAISYKTSAGTTLESHEDFLESYNGELEKADSEIDAGAFLSHTEVAILLGANKK
jgi:hypothetical protein